MIETTIARQVVDRLRLRYPFPESVVIKHKDAATDGVPDIEIALRGRGTCWIELKLLRPRDTLKKLNKAQQLVMCHELGVVNEDRSWVLVFETATRTIVIWYPRFLFRKLYPELAGPPDPEHPNWIRDAEPHDVTGICPAAIKNYRVLLDTFGAVRVRWDYDVVPLLIEDAFHL